MGRWGDGENIIPQSPVNSHQCPMTNCYEVKVSSLWTLAVH
ncbi:hypothetical protein [Nostoc linckia]|nr:hypothetical protein [Nostoc linckia]